jgi:kynurenine 3-monooxygenase
VVRAAMTARGVREDVSTLELAYQEINLPLAGLDRRIMHYWPAGDALFGAFPVVSSPDLFAGSVFLRRHGAAPSYAAAAAGLELAGQFAALFPGLAARIPDLAEQLATKPVATVPLVRCDRWTWGGKVALVGDSCHAMAPFMGQGMNCAFEDARTLVSCLDDTADWARALAAYERVRREDGNAIADISYEHYRTMSRLPSEPSDEVAALAGRLSDLFPDRFTSLYERCAFTEEGYASARANDRRLRSFARDLLHEHGSRLLKIPDSRLREYALPPSTRTPG